MTRDTSARDGLGRNGVIVSVPPSWTSTFTRSPAFKWARSIRAASNIKPCELPILVIVLTMSLNYVLHAILSSRLPGEGFLDGAPGVEEVARCAVGSVSVNRFTWARRLS